jgi:hypothetical protein
MFPILRFRICFRRYRGRHVPILCFAPWPRFERYRGRVVRFHVLRSWTHFRRYRGRRVPFSCFALPNTIWAVPRAPGPVFMFCAPGLVFDDTEYFWSRLHILRSQTRFRHYKGSRGYRGRRVPFSCFALRYSFSVVSRASGVQFSCFVFPDSFSAEPRASVPFSCFALADSFSAVSWASCLVFMFCATRLFFDGTVGVEPYFHVLRFQTRYRRY